jgi:two-component system, OmpR family, sensor kinase
MIARLVGRTMLFRLYVYQALLFASVFASVIVVTRFVFFPSMQAQRVVDARFVAERALSEADEPQRLAGDLNTVGDHMAITVFDLSGRILASTPPAPATALDGSMLARLIAKRSIRLADDRIAVVSSDDGQPMRYAIATVTGPARLLGPAALALFVMVIALVAGSIPLARAIARPLERLARTTRSFGAGDWRVRAVPHPIDELGDVARAFNQMADSVEALRRAEKELLANVSHELRTPLARIRVVVELASEDNSAAVKRYLADIVEDLSEVEQILADIISTARLDLSDERSNDPYPALRLTRLRVGTLLDSLVKRSGEEHPERPLLMSVDETVTLSADRVMLKHAVANVLDNAEKYSLPGSPISLSVRRLEGGSHVEIVIEDKGCGIAPLDLERVFTPFFRSDRSRTRATGGVGLGLTLAKRIVEAHGGSIVIESRIDIGTRVSVSLPLAGSES